MSPLAPRRPRSIQLDPRLQEHLDKLGFHTVAGYKRWCYQNKLPTNVDKSPESFASEVQLFGKQCSDRESSSVSQFHRPVRAAQIRHIYENCVSAAETPFLRRYADALDALSDDEPARNALFRLLIHLEKYAGLFENVGRARGHIVSTYICLAKLHAGWVRPVEDWFPRSQGKKEQFGSLVRHLLARYEIPRFFDRVWFLNPERRRAKFHQSWYLHVANGGNIRTAPGFNAYLTRRMAHLFTQAPPNANMEHAVRLAQVKALGGDHDLARAVIRTRLAEVIEHDDFWFTVLQFFVNNPMLDPTQVDPIVDYIYNQKYVPQEVPQPGGGVVEGPPPHPHFTMKGRSADRLVDSVEEWHGDLAAEDYVAWKEWKPAMFRPFEYEDENSVGNTRSWSIHELTTSWELALEGKTLHHCVRTYANKCASGRTSIWSTQVKIDGENPQPVLTVAVDNEDRKVTHYRGKYNMQPGAKQGSTRKDVPISYIDLLNASASILRKWAEREQLKVK